MKLREVKVAILCCFSVLLYTNFACAGESSYQEPVLLSEYGSPYGMVREYDRNGDGNIDKAIIVSFRGQWLEKKYDTDFDGRFDSFHKRYGIKNLKLSYRNTSAGVVDVIQYEFPDKRYYLIDQDEDGFLDGVRVYDKKLHKNILERRIEVLESFKVSSLFIFDLFSHLRDRSPDRELENELNYIHEQFGQKYNELQELLDEAKSERGNIKKWNILLDKTREYLDLPDNETLPIRLRIAESDQELHGAGAYVYGYQFMKINSEIITDIETWLKYMDHEIFHLIQPWQAYESWRIAPVGSKDNHYNWKEYLLKLTGFELPSWTEMVQEELDREGEAGFDAHHDEPRDLLSLYEELQAYTLEIERAELYTNVLEGVETHSYEVTMVILVHVYLYKQVDQGQEPDLTEYIREVYKECFGLLYEEFPEEDREYFEQLLAQFKELYNLH